ncbi:hypothetical protein [Mucilaginibacter boryungensis]|uniref:Uncharacterized protein n=1 Tax=Mucilaginibacter boryungensis TaxID=768480 RepID=A0ABR9XLJ3_9SPHI|nr:hypothetical protein [Mucilaginibacter boryungensis]MBE9668249.1 hypothetical protein [Mucilaginibacter boryungensis]
MSSKETLLIWTAFSGLAGALLTQLMTGLFSFINDRRKCKQDLKNQFRNKKIEIGENFYFMNGEVMAMIQKNIAYWKNRTDSRSKKSLTILNKEMEKLNSLSEKINAENWKYNLVSIYYELPFQVDEIWAANKKTQKYYLAVIDMSEQIKQLPSTEQEPLYKEYNTLVFNLCSHYEWLYSRMQANMIAVKKALLDGNV